MTLREKTFLVFGLPSDRSSRDQVKHDIQKVGFRDVLIEDDVAYLTVPEYQKLSDVREKLCNSGRHKLTVMPEVAQSVNVVIDDEWSTAILRHRISLDEFHHLVNVDYASTGRIILSGRSNEINKAVKYIEKSVCDALFKQNSFHDKHGDDVECGDGNSNSSANNLIGEEKKSNGIQQKNEKQRREKVGNGLTDHHSDDDKTSENSEEGTRPENGAKLRKSKERREPSEMRRNEREEQSETNGAFWHEGTRADAAITKDEWEYKRRRDENRDLVVCPFRLNDYQLKFIQCFYPEVYKHLKSLQLQKTSGDQIQLYGKPDDVNKMHNWLTDHGVRLVERQQIHTYLSADEVNTVMGNGNRGKWMLTSDVLRDGTCMVTGSLRDIELFRSEITDREIAMMRSSALSKMSATSEDSELWFEFTTPRSSINVIIAKGDLTKQDTKAIVSPSNSFLKPFGGAAKAIATAAGHQLTDECSKYIRIHGSLSTTKVMHTSAGRMYPPIQYVIHACGPTDKSDRKLEEDLEKTFINCFKCAQELGVKSLSVPAISSGVFRVKKDVVARCTWNALMRFDEEISAKALERASLKEICFINIDSEATESLVKTFRKCSNEYRFTQAETASIESDQSQNRKVRRSNSFSELRSKLIGEKNLNERSLLKTIVTEKSSTNSSVINPKDMASGVVSVPKIKGVPSAAASEAKCAVCMKQRPISHLNTQSSCPHKCISCLKQKCYLCEETRKLDSGFRSNRSALRSSPLAASAATPAASATPPAASSEVNSRKSFVSPGSRRRSASVSERGRGSLNENSDSDESHSSPVKTVQKKTQKEEDDSDCCICMDTIKDAKRLDCGHTFCRSCIDRAFLHQPKCPSCGKIFGLLRGNQPDGTMTIRKERSLELSGYRGDGAIVIVYDIPDGVQSSCHPNPGKRFRGTHRSAYLPGNAEGEEICRLLKKAFDAKLIFTIGKSNTTGRENVVVWNDIHHKTDMSGQYGYPDSTYLKRVREELAAKGIKSSSSSPPALTSDDDDDSKKTPQIDSPLMSDVSLKTGTRTTDRYPMTTSLFYSSNYSYSLPSALHSAEDSSHSRTTAFGSYAGSSSSQAASSLLSYPSGVTQSRSSGAGAYNGRSSNTRPYKH